MLLLLLSDDLKESFQIIVRFQVLTAASMMFTIVFWVILPCKMIVDNQYNPEDNSELPDYCSHNVLSSSWYKKHRLNYSPTTNSTPHSHFLIMKWNLMFCVGIFNIPVTNSLGVHRTTEMKSSLITHEKKHWINISVVDRL
jgi:hypothetical protein